MNQFDNSFLGIIIVCAALFLGLCALIMPLVVISMHTVISKRAKEAKAEADYNAQLLVAILKETQKRK